MKSSLRILFLALACCLAACVSVTNPVTNGLKMPKAEAIRTIAAWPIPGTKIRDVPEEKFDKLATTNLAAPPTFAAKVTQVDERSFTYLCSYAKADHTFHGPMGAGTMSAIWYHLEPGRTGRLDFANVSRIEHYRATLGEGWTWVALYDARRKRLIRFFCETHDRPVYAQQVRHMQTLADAFAALCPNAH
jgi:hypothetical protein